MEPKVSVIIPTFNRGSLVGNSIESALRQTYADLEVIVVDDGSTDGTGDILRREYGDRVRYFYQANQGQSVAFNAGIAQAKGEWLAFLASDDLWRPDKTALQVRTLGQSGPSCAACFTDAEFFNDPRASGTVFQLCGCRFESPTGVVREPIRLLVSPHPVPPIWVQTLMARAEVVRGIGGFDARLRFGEDDEFLFRLAKATGFCYVSRALTRIDRRPQTSRHTGPNESWDRIQFRLQHNQYRFEKRLELCSGLPPYVRRAVLRDLRCVHSAWANLYLETGDQQKALEAATTAVRYSPDLLVILKWAFIRFAPSVAAKAQSLRSARSDVGFGGPR